MKKERKYSENLTGQAGHTTTSEIGNSLAGPGRRRVGFKCHGGLSWADAGLPARAGPSNFNLDIITSTHYSHNCAPPTTRSDGFLWTTTSSCCCNARSTSSITGAAAIHAAATPSIEQRLRQYKQ